LSVAPPICKRPALQFFPQYFSLAIGFARE
jgi:hypothetical protein